MNLFLKEEQLYNHQFKMKNMYIMYSYQKSKSKTNEFMIEGGRWGGTRLNKKFVSVKNKTCVC